MAKPFRVRELQPHRPTAPSNLGPGRALVVYKGEKDEVKLGGNLRKRCEDL